MRVMMMCAAAAAWVAMVIDARAATLVTKGSGQSNNWSLYIDTEATVFDSIQVDVIPAPGVGFGALSSGTGRVAGDPNTFRNRVLDADKLDGGKGWLVPGAVVNATTFSFGGGPPGEKISSAGEPNGDLFLANFFFTGAPSYGLYGLYYATFKVQLVNEGVTIDTLTWPPVPEPTAITLASMGLVGQLTVRRRSPKVH